MGGKRRSQQLSSWKDVKDSTWNFKVDAVAVNQQLTRNKRALEKQLVKVSSKRMRLECEVRELKKKNSEQTKLLARSFGLFEAR